MRALAGALIVAVPLLVLVGRAGSAAPPGKPDVGGAVVPRGMVAFTTGAGCPSGWAPAAVAAGRLLVGTDQLDVVGRTVGEPLAAEEDRVHGHGAGAATLALPYKSISAADGGNQQGAGAGAQPLTATVDGATSGLPFVQLTACVAP